VEEEEEEEEERRMATFGSVVIRSLLTICHILLPVHKSPWQQEEDHHEVLHCVLLLTLRMEWVEPSVVSLR
jgi:hypothetical protein